MLSEAILREETTEDFMIARKLQINKALEIGANRIKIIHFDTMHYICSCKTRRVNNCIKNKNTDQSMGNNNLKPNERKKNLSSNERPSSKEDCGVNEPRPIFRMGHHCPPVETVNGNFTFGAYSTCATR